MDSNFIESSNSGDKVLVSIVTVVYNAEDVVESTIESVLSQNYSNFEYIIIDGASTDKTTEIIAKYSNSIKRMVSEPDEGIYDAMNKALDLASGEWINFMNAGDIFASGDTLTNIFSKNISDETIIYGDVMVNYGSFSVLKRSGDIDKMWSGMKFQHQSAFIKLDYHRKNKYNRKYKVASDFDFFLRAKQDGCVFKKLDFPVSEVITGGVSERNRIFTLQESRKIAYTIDHNLFHDLIYRFKILDISLRDLLKKILPNYIVNRLIKLKK